MLTLLASAALLMPMASASSLAPKSAAFVRFASLPGANVITAVATDYAFEMPSTLPAGLTTIRFSNKGKELYHICLVKIEKGKKPEDVLACF